jgi:hypothetical protein
MSDLRGPVDVAFIKTASHCRRHRVSETSFFIQTLGAVAPLAIHKSIPSGFIAHSTVVFHKAHKIVPCWGFFGSGAVGGAQDQLSPRPRDPTIAVINDVADPLSERTGRHYCKTLAWRSPDLLLFLIPGSNCNIDVVAEMFYSPADYRKATLQISVREYS